MFLVILFTGVPTRSRDRPSLDADLPQEADPPSVADPAAGWVTEGGGWSLRNMKSMQPTLVAIFL